MESDATEKGKQAEIAKVNECFKYWWFFYITEDTTNEREKYKRNCEEAYRAGFIMGHSIKHFASLASSATLTEEG